MRLRRLGLLRFGRFTDRVVDLPAMRPDFHLIVGPNEAGKSTIRRAVSDLLFGIEGQTPFDFLHAYAEMRLSAVIEDGAQATECQRLKRNKQSLRNTEDEPLPDDALAPYLGGTSQDFFERMFGLDHARLVEGGLAILEAKDDVARLLFEASAGLATLGPVRDELEREAKSLWDKRRSGDRAYYKAADALKSAEDALKEVTVRAKAWREKTEALDKATRALEDVTEDHRALEATRARLERIRRVAPHIRTLHDGRREARELGDAVLLTPDAGAQLEAARISVARAVGELGSLEQQIRDAEAQQRQITVDERLLDHRDAIEKLIELHHKVKDHPRDLRARKAEVDALARNAATLAAQLGWEASDAHEVEKKLPSHLVRGELDALLTRYVCVSEKLTQTSRGLEEREAEIQELGEEIERISGVGASPGLKIALEAARDLGDIERRKRDAEKRVGEERRRFEAALARLAPWVGSLERLRAIALPAEETVRVAQEREREIAGRLRAADSVLEGTAADVAIAEAEDARLRDALRPIMVEDLDTARCARDDQWQAIKRDPTTLTAAAGAYEASVATADELADRRYASAADVERLEAVRAAILTLRAKQQGHENTIARERADRDALTAEWSDSLTALVPFRPTPTSLLAWLRHRSDALAAADALATEEEELAHLSRGEAEAARGLRAALAADGIAIEPVEDLALRGLVALIAEIVTTADSDKVRRAELEGRREKELRALGRLRASADAARSEAAAWQSAWEQAVVAAGLARATSPAVGRAALDLLAQLEACLRNINDIQRSRIATMQRDLDAFAGDAAELANAVAPDLDGRSAGEIATELSSRLAAAVRAREAAAKLARDLEGYRSRIAHVTEQQRVTAAQLAPLMDSAGTRDLEELRHAIERSDKLRAIEQTIERSMAEALRAGDGLPLEQLEEEIAAEDLATVVARWNAAQDSLSDVVARRDECRERKSAAQSAWDEVHGQDDAASAESRRQQALAEMADVTARFVKVFIAARLLRWSIDRYREEKQGPLLRRAGEIFATLTLGSFDRLTVDFEGDTPQLVARRPAGTSVGVTGMSEGTRDQLYLSLRLAAVELHLVQGRALPFIADDLFINYDDERAAAGFKVLSELAMRTQVIFLTHHDHLVPVARDAIAEDIDVVSL